ncbi:tetratricopeptide repeat protein [Capnocytophaga canimorsus]|uniref:tetratricopeptide repeat protein n=1 Tax=Capnocytophaga canimorsus TaxID=28188 RepID=UPI0037D734B1
MKKQILMASALLVTAVAFGQKKELREVAKNIKKGDLEAAQSALNQVKQIAAANQDYETEYYFLEGLLGFESAKKGRDVMNSLSKASQAFTKVRELENSQKGKFTSQIPLKEAVDLATQQGTSAYERKDYKNAKKAFEQVYRLSPQDTVFLYNAAVLAVQDKDYDTALKHYIELKNLRYDGAETLYLAKNKQSQKEETFTSKNQRDLMVKSGSYINPRTEKTPSKRGEIVKNIALIYVEQGKNDQAINAFEEARKAFPKDATLVIAEASVYLQLNDRNKFKELMEEAAKLSPENADIQYNIGVINMEQGQLEAAREAFKQALKLRPNYTDAVLNYSTTYINEGNALIEQMNALGNSKADIKKYDELGQQKDMLYRKAVEFMEEYIKVQGNETSVLEQLKNVYGALGDTANFKRIKALLE